MASLLNKQPWVLQPAQFHEWYMREIQDGVNSYESDCNRVVDEVVRVLHESALDVKEVVKGGSLAKGTVLKEHSDFDCVIFLNPPAFPFLKDVRNISSYTSDSLSEANKKIEKVISESKRFTKVETERLPFYVAAEITVYGITLNVDLLPTADNVFREGKQGLYESMIRRSVSDRELYSVGLAKLQINFVKKQPGMVKELIRIVKYWNKLTVEPSSPHGPLLPKSYPIELITILTWEQARRPTNKHLEGLKAVLITIRDIQDLSHFWTDNYSDAVAQKGIQHLDPTSRKRPIILDPANPTSNVCSGYAWGEVARIARDTLRSNLLKDVRLDGWQQK